jgi:hypothetical protein
MIVMDPTPPPEDIGAQANGSIASAEWERGAIELVEPLLPR